MNGFIQGYSSTYDLSYIHYENSEFLSNFSKNLNKNILQNTSDYRGKINLASTHITKVKTIIKLVRNL